MSAAPAIVTRLLGWFGWAGALGDNAGTQVHVPRAALIDGVRSMVTADTALQIGTIWACAERRANIIASLPFETYNVPIKGKKTLAVGDRLYQLLHDEPNPRMTPFQFWRALMLNHDLRGNGYARIMREASTGEALALWPMPSDQVEEFITPDGSMFYLYRVSGAVFILPEDDVLHIKGLGNGTSGLAKLEFMAATVGESASQQSAAHKTFGNGGKPTAVLMTDKVLKADQRSALQERFAEMAHGSEARLFVLEADMKYQQLSATAEQIQLLESRKYTTEELCRWMDTPPELVYLSSRTAWGSGIDAIVEGFHKFTIGPLCVSIEQSVRKRVMTARQRSTMSCEMNLDALLRATPTARFTLYSLAAQNGILTRNEMRGLENWPAMGPEADVLTAQANLVPLDMLGKTPPPGPGGAPPEAPVKQ